MDYHKFIQQLPDLYKNWGQELVCPKDNRFGQLLAQVKGMTSANVMQLLNFAVGCLETDEIYCEVGCFQGSTLISALLDHPNQMAYAVDNFSEFDPLGKNLEKLIKNLTTFNLEEQVCFSNQNFEQFFLELRRISTSDKIGVYFYDGAHDYRSQLLGLLLVKPFLAEKAVIIVDDSNWSAVQQANWDFIAAHPQCSLLLDLPTPQNGHGTFWNGIHVLSWDVNRKSNYDWSVLKKNRQESIIEAIYKLQ
ncbi:MAG: class I SAM-dependent methyltransferase [Potamolinea sp.]